MNSPHQSVLRNVYPQQWKEKFSDLKLSSKSADGSMLAVSTEYIAVSWEAGGGGTVGVISHAELGKRNPQSTLFRGHKGAVQDIQFSPFFNSIFITASDDCTIKLWDIPGNDSELRRDCVSALTGHEKRVMYCHFNPLTEWVVASASMDCTIKSWDFEVQKNAATVRLSQPPNCLRWNYSGSLLALTSKDKLMHIVDIRGKHAELTTAIHQGAKPSKCEWLDTGENYLISVGFTPTAAREYNIYDTRKFKEPILSEQIDNASGIIQPFCDSATGLVVLLGKGEGTVRFYEWRGSELGTLNSSSLTPACRDISFIPKRGVSVEKCEVMRMYKVEGNSVIQPASLTVPRQNPKFQSLLFPPCPNGEPAMSSADWFGGKLAMPLVADMESVDGVSPFAQRKPENVQNLKFATPAPVSAVSMSRSVLSKKLSIREKQLESEIENQTEIIGKLNSMEVQAAEKDKLIVSLQKQLVAAVNRAQESEVQRDKLSQQIKELKAAGPMTPPKSAAKQLQTTPSTAATPTGPAIDLSEARIELKRTQEEAAATIVALQGLSVAVDNCKDLDMKQKQLLQSLEKLMSTFQKAASATGIKTAQTVSEGPDTEMLLARIRALEARNKELEVLFSSLQAIGRVTANEKAKSQITISSNKTVKKTGVL